MSINVCFECVLFESTKFYKLILLMKEIKYYTHYYKNYRSTHIIKSDQLYE